VVSGRVACGTGPRGESELLQEFRSNLQQKNKLLRSFIGMGYYGTITPAVIQRYMHQYIYLSIYLYICISALAATS
jgi:glycine cleavage system pyridoxal-binding protein P